MSDLVESVLLDAQSLSWRVKSSDVTADRLIEQANVLTAQVQAMKRFREEMASLNESGARNPRTALIQSINQESLHIRLLQKENRELSHCLEEYHNAIELIMTKYRRQMGAMMSLTEQNTNINTRQQQHHLDTLNSTSLLKYERKIEEMAAVMRHAADADSDADRNYRQIISQLQVENQGLRELLRISREYGSSRMGANETVINVAHNEQVSVSHAGARVISCHSPPATHVTEPSTSSRGGDVSEPLSASSCVAHVSEPLSASSPAAHVSKLLPAIYPVAHVSEPLSASSRAAHISEPLSDCSRAVHISVPLSASSRVAHVSEPLLGSLRAVELSSNPLNGGLKRRELRTSDEEVASCSVGDLPVSVEVNGILTCDPDPDLTVSLEGVQPCDSDAELLQASDRCDPLLEGCQQRLHDGETESDSDATVILDDSSLSFS